MTVREVHPSMKCSLCHQDLRKDALVYASKTAQMVHRVCLERIIGSVAQTPHIALENGRQIDQFDTRGLQRIIYVLVGAVSLCAFGVLDSLARVLIVVTTAASFGYLLARGSDKYASWRAIHRVSFS